MTYSDQLPMLLQTYFNLLKTNGLVIFNFDIEMDTANLKHQYRFRTDRIESNVVNVNGKSERLGLIDWIKTIPGIEIIDYADRGDVTKAHQYVALKIRKINDTVQVPQNLLTVEYIPTGPPVRRFKLITPR